MKELANRYPVGIQSFMEIRTKGYLYVDKTDSFCGDTQTLSDWIVHDAD